MSVERMLWDNDATGLAELAHKGEISPRELVDAAIARRSHPPQHQRHCRAALRCGAGAGEISRSHAAWSLSNMTAKTFAPRANSR
jgi:hypothetical protein